MPASKAIASSVVPSKPFSLNSLRPVSTIRWRVSHRFRSRRRISAGASTAVYPLLTKCTECKYSLHRVQVSHIQTGATSPDPSGGRHHMIFEPKNREVAARTQASRHSRDSAPKAHVTNVRLAAKEALVPYTPRYRALLRAGFAFFSAAVMAAVLTACSKGSAPGHCSPPRPERGADQVLAKP